MFLLFEFHFSAAGGEIFNLCLPELAEMVSENDIIRLIKQILEGVCYLHQNNIVHLDLKVRYHMYHLSNTTSLSLLLQCIVASWYW